MLTTYFYNSQLLLVLQIIAMQTLHYVTLSVLIPPLLIMFAESGSLEYEGGAANVGMPYDSSSDWSLITLDRDDHGLEGDGRKTNHTRVARRRPLHIVESEGQMLVVLAHALGLALALALMSSSGDSTP